MTKKLFLFLHRRDIIEVETKKEGLETCKNIYSS